MKYIHVRNLEKYNPGYKDRPWHWGKIHFSMVQGDYECEMLCEIDWSRFVKFILIELESKKPTPINEVYLSRKGFDFGIRKLCDTMDSLKGFIEISEDDGKTKKTETEKVSKEKPERKQFSPLKDNEIAEHYFKLKRFDTKSIAGTDWSRAIKALDPIRERTLDSKEVLDALNWLSNDAQKNNYSWTLETLDKKWMEIISQKKVITI